MFKNKIYQRRVKAPKFDNATEKETVKIPIGDLETPAKPTPARPKKVYVKRNLKKNLGPCFASIVYAHTSSPGETNDLYNLSIRMGVIEKDQNFSGTGGTCLDSTGLIDLNRSVYELQNVAGSVSEDPEDSGKGVINWEEELKGRKDGKTCTDGEANCIDFLGSKEPNEGLDDWVAPSVNSTAELLCVASPDSPADCVAPSVNTTAELLCVASPDSPADWVAPSVNTTVELLSVASPDSSADSSVPVCHFPIHSSTQEEPDRIFFPGDRGFLLVTNSPDVAKYDQPCVQDNLKHVGGPVSSAASATSQDTKGPEVGIGLNKRPRQKIRRKKHRPKIMVAGKAKRTQKPSIPKQATPENPSSGQILSKKRKYVRKSDKENSPREDVVTPKPADKRKNVKNSRQEKLAAKDAVRDLNFDLGSEDQKHSPREDAIVKLATPKHVEKRKNVKNGREEKLVKEDAVRALNFDLGSQVQKKAPREDVFVRIATPKHAEKRKNVKKISREEKSVTEDSIRALNFELGSQSRDEISFMTATHQYGLQNETDDKSESNCNGTTNKSVLQGSTCLSSSKKLGPNFPNRCKKKRMSRGWKVNLSGLRFLIPLDNLEVIACSWSLKGKRSKRRPTFKFTKKMKRSKRLTRLCNLNNLIASPVCNQLPIRPQAHKDTSLEGNHEMNASQSEMVPSLVNLKIQNCANPLLSISESQEIEIIHRHETCRDAEFMEATERWTEMVPSLVCFECHINGPAESPSEHQSLVSLEHQPLKHGPVFSLEHYQLVHEDLWLTAKDPLEHEGVQLAANSKDTQEILYEDALAMSFGRCVPPPSSMVGDLFLYDHGLHHQHSSLLRDNTSIQVDFIIQKLKGLYISDRKLDHNAQGAHSRRGRHVGSFKATKKRKTKKPKLDFEPDTQLMVLDQSAYDPHCKPGRLVPYLGPFTPTKKQRSKKPKHLNPKTQLMVLDLNAQDPHCNPGTLVPLIKKRKMKTPKVDLDQETIKEWELVMKIDGKDGENADETRKKWWEGERKVFRGRIDLFINRMHLLQADRKFKPWKGSVVDSVVGVFLTQNVSDHLSSNSYMTLVAKYPIQSTSNHEARHEDWEISNNLELYNSEGQKYFVKEPPEETLVGGLQESSLIEVEDGKAVNSTFDDGQESGYATSKEQIDYGSQILSSDELDDLKDASISLFDTQDPFVVPLCSSRLEVDPPGIPNLNASHKSNKSAIAEECTSGTVVNQYKLLAKCGVPQECSSQEKVGPEGTINIQSQKMPVDESGCIVDEMKQSKTSKMQQLAQDATSMSKKRRRGKTLNKVKEQKATPRKNMKNDDEKEYWRSMRSMYTKEGPRDSKHMDSADWGAVRCAEFGEVIDTIKDRGQQTILGRRIQKFLEEEFQEYKCIDLEWLRNAPPDKVKEYLLKIEGLGLKSVECVRLLSLQNVAFPVDTNVGRIAVRLGWVPLEPLPEDMQIHLLAQYPLMDSIQKYLWPRLCTLNQEELYELHYQMITFGKVFCTKKNPNCNACPMKAECKHFASAYASAKLALPGPAEKRMGGSVAPVVTVENPAVVVNPEVTLVEIDSCAETGYRDNKDHPIIEMPASPQLESAESLEPGTEEDSCKNGDSSSNRDSTITGDSSSEIPNIELDIEEFKRNLHDVMYRKNMMVQDTDVSKALVALTPEAAYIPMPKLKYYSHLRTEHLVYELPDKHDLLKGFEEREPDDPSPYLLAIWTPGETANSFGPPKRRCNSKESELCNEKTCFSCNSIREQSSNMIRVTILIPCRTATRGSFPLNGTYFQINEVFADDETSNQPISVPRELLYKLKPRAAYFGTSVSAIFKGLSTRQIQLCFWTGFLCVRGFDRKMRAPRPLFKRLHCSPSQKGKTVGDDE